MRGRTIVVLSVLTCLAVALPLLSQQAPARGTTPAPAAAAADPVSGTWSGDWGPSPQDRNQVTVELKLAGKNVTGVVKTANRQEVTLTKSTFDAATNALHMEADATGRGGAVHYVIQGKIDKNTISGSWDHGDRKGDFKLTKK